ncbi:B- and T-lymphocyte attenuator [Gasterosteus aculeatus]
MSRTSLRTLCCFTFICIFCQSQDVFPCDVEVLVPRGTTVKTVPQRPVTVRCPVQHCGESVNVTWCKVLNTNKCEPVSFKRNSEIRQSDERVEEKLISCLTFTRISIHDSGLYRCTVKGYEYESISHAINISVSDSNQGEIISDHDADEPRGPADDEDVPSLSYVFICVTIAAPLVTLTALWLLALVLNLLEKTPVNLTEGNAMQEKSTHMIPGLPAETRAPCYTYSQSAAERPPRSHHRPPPAIAGNTADGRQATADRVVYAVINHQQGGRTK